MMTTLHNGTGVSSEDKRMRTLLMRAWVVVLGLMGVASLASCDSGVVVGQSTPEATISTAREMVLAGEAYRLHEVVYADTPEMRQFLSRTGRLLRNLDQLSTSIQQRWPNEVAALKARAEEDAKRGRPSSLVGQLAQSAMQQNRRRRGPPRGDERKGFDDAITRIFADPYGMLRESDGRLTVQYVTDDQQALLWDGKPVLAPLGMFVRKEEESGKWYFVLPLSFPGVSSFMPKTKEQWEVFGTLVTVIDKMAVDLRTEIERGDLKTMEAVSRRAGEMAFMPAVLTFYAYTKLRDEQKKGG